MNKPFILALSLLSVLVFLSAALYFGYIPMQKKKLNILEAKEEKLPEKSRQKLAQFYTQLNALDKLLEQRKEIADIFSAIFSNLNREAVVESFYFSVDTKTLEIKGVASNSSVLTNQLNVLKDIRGVESVSTQIIQETQKAVSFKLLISLK